MVAEHKRDTTYITGSLRAVFEGSTAIYSLIQSFILSFAMDMTGDSSERPYGSAALGRPRSPSSCRRLFNQEMLFLMGHGSPVN